METLAKDYSRAYAWLTLSSEDDYCHASAKELLNQFQQKMTKEEYDQAKVFIRNYKSEFEENGGWVYWRAGADQDYL